MYLFNLNVEEILSFFAVMVRYSVLFAIVPIFGDRSIPALIKIFFSLALTVTLYPALVASHFVDPLQAAVWGRSAPGIVSTVALETLFGLVLGFTAKLVFDGVSIGANLIGNFMGFASASVFDPHQESQTEVVAQLQTTLAMLVFLAMDGHHLILKAALQSYRVVGLGQAGLTAALSERMIQMTGEVFQFGLQLAAPVAIVIFTVNILFGVFSKAIPQVNILVLSFSACAFIGFLVIGVGNAEFLESAAEILSNVSTWMESAMQAIAKGG